MFATLQDEVSMNLFCSFFFQLARFIGWTSWYISAQTTEWCDVCGNLSNKLWNVGSLPLPPRNVAVFAVGIRARALQPSRVFVCVLVSRLNQEISKSYYIAAYHSQVFIRVPFRLDHLRTHSSRLFLIWTRMHQRAIQESFSWTKENEIKEEEETLLSRVYVHASAAEYLWRLLQSSCRIS